jgi:hypothetical protein
MATITVMAVSFKGEIRKSSSSLRKDSNGKLAVMA